MTPTSNSEMSMLASLASRMTLSRSRSSCPDILPEAVAIPPAAFRTMATSLATRSRRAASMSTFIWSRVCASLSAHGIADWGRAPPLPSSNSGLLVTKFCLRLTTALLTMCRALSAYRSVDSVSS